MNKDNIREIHKDAYRRLLESRCADGMWRGCLSSSPISTSVSIFALHCIDADKYKEQIDKGVAWLKDTMKEDGSWGDSTESPSNMTATLLSFTSLHAVGAVPENTRIYLNEKFGGDTEKHLTEGVLNYYGKDLTFSVPILMMCAMSGVIHNWDAIPPFPFELATLPQKLFRYANLPVVSYAIPALIAIGICQMKRKGGLITSIRSIFVPKAMKVLERMQPEDGGYLEAAPLTAFVSMCLAKSGFKDNKVTHQCARFLVETVREDGSWPIDTNLSCWLTSLSAKILRPSDAADIDFVRLTDILKSNATRHTHPFTAAQPGGWGWSDLSGSVPDGDDTSGALVALYHLTDLTADGKDKTCPEEAKNGLRWLMRLQNNDGGMPTFCKGWGKLPFDRSTPDITAHAILAMGLWLHVIDGQLRKDVEKSLGRMILWMRNNTVGTQNTPQGWVPLWFGDQDAEDEKAPVYGTATTIDYLMSSGIREAMELAESQLQFLISTQNTDGGWGGNKGIRSKVTYTSKALAALSHYHDKYDDVREKGWSYLYSQYKEGNLYRNEPIGLYFSRLWYSESLYNVTFILNATRNELDE